MSHPGRNILLRAAVIACFFLHGIVAWYCSDLPVSEWNVWLQRILPGDGVTGARHALRTFGTLDILVALALLLVRIPRVAFAWTIGWGFATALSRWYFLGSVNGPFWVTMAHPFAEVLIRTANWVVPLLLLMRTTQVASGLRRIREETWIRLVVTCTAGAMTLSYLAECHAPFFPLSVLKTGKPLWLFHASGILAGWALLGSIWPQRYLPTLVRPFAAAAPLVAYALSEAIAASYMYVGKGLTFAIIQVGEHAPVWLSLIWFCTGALSNSGAAWLRLTSVLSLKGVMHRQGESWRRG